MRNAYDEIHDSIVNGQIKQSFAQMVEIGIDDMPDLLDFLAEYDPAIAIKAAKIYFNLFHTMFNVDHNGESTASELDFISSSPSTCGG